MDLLKYLFFSMLSITFTVGMACAENSSFDFSPSKHLQLFTDNFYSEEKGFLQSAIEQYPNNPETFFYIAEDYPEPYIKISEIDQQWDFTYKGKKYFVEYYDAAVIVDISDKQTATNDYTFNIYTNNELVTSVGYSLENQAPRWEYITTPVGGNVQIKRKSHIVEERTIPLSGTQFTASTNFFPLYLQHQDSIQISRYDFANNTLIFSTIEKGEGFIRSYSTVGKKKETHYYYNSQGIATKFIMIESGVKFIKVDSIAEVLKEREFSEIAQTRFSIGVFPINRFIPRRDELNELHIKVHYKQLPLEYNIEKLYLNGNIVDIHTDDSVIEILARFKERTSFADPKYLTFDTTLYGNDISKLSNLAISIVKDETEPRKQIILLTNWVHSYLTYDPFQSEQNAIEIFNNKRGDCTEYAKLLTALAKSLNIPCKTVFGYLLGFNGFGAHSWVIANIEGRWIGIDPTNSLIGTDLSYIMSPFEDQYLAINFVEVISAKYTDGKALYERLKPSPSAFIQRHNNDSSILFLTLPELLQINVKNRSLAFIEQTEEDIYNVREDSSVSLALDFMNPSGMMIVDLTEYNTNTADLRDSKGLYNLNILENEMDESILVDRIGKGIVNPFFPDLAYKEYKKLSSDILFLKVYSQKYKNQYWVYYNSNGYCFSFTAGTPGAWEKYYLEEKIPPFVNDVIEGIRWY